ncbi:MAG: GntR family transcriptional regulator [Comamonadaceae bacterium]|nr:MAG: GntR family transcriptional regulator [Comamonadaceae bacterium]
MSMTSSVSASASAPPLYRRLATHYRGAIEAGSLRPGERMPSLRHLMRLHDISLSTALQLCRTLESDGWAEARARSGYFVRHSCSAVDRLMSCSRMRLRSDGMRSPGRSDPASIAPR